MSRKMCSSVLMLVVVAVLVTMFSVTMFAAGETKGKADGLEGVYLKGMKMQSNQASTNAIPVGLEKKAYLSEEEGPYIIVFTGPIKEEMKSTVNNLGATLVEYVPDFAYLSLMTPDVAARVGRLTYVRNIEIYQPAYKINPSLKDEYGNLKLNKQVTVRIATFDNGTLDVDREILNARGQKVTTAKGQVVAKVYSHQLAGLAQLNSVKFIEEVPQYQLFNDVAKGYIDVDDIWTLGYTGAGQVIGICDTGLDTGKNDTTMHLDFQGRIDAIYALGRTTANDTNGHGTHVAGSVLGNGARSNGQIKGMAPEAHMVFQSVLDSTGGLGGLPTNLNTLFTQSWNAGARIHTNSWGAAVNGDYNANAQEVDQYVWNNDMIILFAAGNEGSDDAWRQVYYNTISSPGSAKNCITVGASENYRPTMGWVGECDNPNEIAIFSSRGTTEDGRVKPDVVAPGTWILSTRSTLAPDTSFWGNYNTYYAYMGGTSMATPITAGAVALARQYMQTNWNHTPSPAMMKAAIINGATDMGFGYPSKDQGWGRVSLTNTLTAKEYNYVDETVNLTTGQTQTYSYAVESASTPLKITLVWTDYPGSTTATKALVNDLDLKITSPSGVIYYGNDFTSPFNSTVDRLNNVENVFINAPEVGTYTVEVKGYNIPQGPQPFALFSSANFGTIVADTTAPTCSLTAPVAGATLSNAVTLSATASDNQGVSRVEFYVDGAKVGTATSAPYSLNWDSKTVANGTHSVNAKAFDAAGNVGTSATISVTVNNTSVVTSTTSTFTGTAKKSYPKTFTFTTTAAGTITLSLTQSSYLSMKLYSPSGATVASGTSSITYNATAVGTYKVVVTSTSKNYVSFTLKATYPVLQ